MVKSAESVTSPPVPPPERPASRGGETPDGRKVRGTLHWLSAAHAEPAEFRLYDHLFTLENMDTMGEGKEYGDYLNPDSLTVRQGFVEPSLAEAEREKRFQFLRKGYFVADRVDHVPGQRPVFNRTVGLKDSWAKIRNKAGG